MGWVTKLLDELGEWGEGWRHRKMQYFRVVRQYMVKRNAVGVSKRTGNFKSS